MAGNVHGVVIPIARKLKLLKVFYALHFLRFFYALFENVQDRRFFDVAWLLA